MLLRTCVKCGVEKSHTYFLLNVLYTGCDTCRSAAKKAYREANKEKILAYERRNKNKWRADNPEADKASRKRHRDSHKEERAAYQKANPKKRTAWNAKYNKKISNDITKSYAKSILACKGWSRKDLTPSLIGYQQESIKLHREIKLNKH